MNMNMQSEDALVDLAVEEIKFRDSTSFNKLI